MAKDMNIVLIGYGNMGHEIEAIAQQRGHSVIAKFFIDEPLPPATSDFFKKNTIDCCIDFSSADAVRHNAETCSTLKIPLVEGTTGWHQQKEEILEIVRKNGGTFVYGNNFSVGAQMFFRIVRNAAELMNGFTEYDPAIHEAHHTKKKDAPSGTALTLAQTILSRLKRKNTVKPLTDLTPLQPNELSVSSSRVGSVFGTHSVLFHSPADEIELVHRAHNRSGFASGAVLAAELTKEFPGIFSFEELVFEKSINHH